MTGWSKAAFVFVLLIIDLCVWLCVCVRACMLVVVLALVLVFVVVFVFELVFVVWGLWLWHLVGLRFLVLTVCVLGGCVCLSQPLAYSEAQRKSTWV